MPKLPTDLQILEDIYKSYYPVFELFTKETPDRSSKNYVPIDIKQIARHFDIDADIVFGRLYYYLDKKYGFVQSDGTKVPFFTVQAGKDRHAIQFPLLSSVLAQMREERNKHLWGITLSVIAIIISAVSLGISILNRIP